MNIEISNQLILSEIPPDFLREIKQRLTLENPVWLENQKMKRWQGQTPQFLKYWQEPEGGLNIPRGFISQLISLAERSGITYQIVDRCRTLPEVDFQFAGTLRDFQQEAVTSMLCKDFGTLAAPTGSGKTVMACHLIAERKQPCLIIVHTRELLNQWVDRIETFLGIPRKEIGGIGGGKRKIGEKITVGIVNSIYPIAKEIRQHIGFLVVDECHRAPSRTFTEAVSAFDSPYQLGLSATPWRRDGLSRLIFWYVGDVQHTVDKNALLESGDILRADVVYRETDFTTDRDASKEYAQVLSELTQNEIRNLLIVGDVIAEASNGSGVSLVLSDRKEHCTALADLLSAQGMRADVLHGDVCNGARQAIVERLNSGDVRVLIATGQLIGEGFDAKSLQTLFLATPIKFDGRLTQYLGRVLRPAPGKDKAKVFDYVDSHVGVLAASARARQLVYQTGG